MLEPDVSKGRMASPPRTSSLRTAASARELIAGVSAGIVSSLLLLASGCSTPTAGAEAGSTSAAHSVSEVFEPAHLCDTSAQAQPWYPSTVLLPVSDSVNSTGGISQGSTKWDLLPQAEQRRSGVAVLLPSDRVLTRLGREDAQRSLSAALRACGAAVNHLHLTHRR